MCKIPQTVLQVSLILTPTDCSCRYFGKEEQGFLLPARIVEDDASLVKKVTFQNNDLTYILDTQAFYERIVSVAEQQSRPHSQNRLAKASGPLLSATNIPT